MSRQVQTGTQGTCKCKITWDTAPQAPTCTQVLGSTSTAICVPSLLGDFCSAGSPEVRDDVVTIITLVTEQAVTARNTENTLV